MMQFSKISMSMSLITLGLSACLVLQTAYANTQSPITDQGVIQSLKNAELIEKLEKGKYQIELHRILDENKFAKNPDGMIFYKTQIYITISDGRNKTTNLLGDYFYTPKDYSFGRMTPAVAIDLDSGSINVFILSKVDRYNYLMEGFAFNKNINDNKNWTKANVFTNQNWGWYSFFSIDTNNKLRLQHFSFDGYYDMVSYLDNKQWKTDKVQSITPDNSRKRSEKQGKFFVDSIAERAYKAEQERLLAEQRAAKAEQERLLAEQKAAEAKAKAEQERLLAEQRAAEAKAKAEQERLLAEQRAQEKAQIQQHLNDFRANLKGKVGKTTYNSPSGYKYEGEHKDGVWHGLGKLTIPNGNDELSKWQGQGDWQGDNYIVQGAFVNGELDLACEPTKKACDKARKDREKARLEAEKAEKARLERERKANEEACKSRYVGERLRLEAPYKVSSFIFFSETKYERLPFKVVGVGKDRMTVEAVYDGGIIGEIESANVPCNATSLR